MEDALMTRSAPSRRTSSGARPRRRTRSRARPPRTAAARPSGTPSATRPGRTLNGDTGDVAADHYHRWPEDVAHITDLGLQRLPVLDRLAARAAGRLGRVQPGRASTSTRGWWTACWSAGIQPGRHALPLGPAAGARGRRRLAEPGDRPAVRRSTRAGIVEALGDRVHAWTTLNEPWCSAYLGYASGVHAPGRTDRRRRWPPCTTSTSRTAWPAGRSGSAGAGTPSCR